MTYPDKAATAVMSSGVGLSVTLIMLLTLLSSLAFASPLALTGSIARITIAGNKNIAAGDIRAALAQKIGDPYSPQAAEKDRAAIQSLGFFRDAVAVAAASDPAGGVDETYTVVEYPIVHSIQFTANTPDKEPTIPAAMLLAQMTVKPGQTLNANALARDMNALFNDATGYVAQQGYLFELSAAPTMDAVTDTVTIPLIEAHVQSIQITGNLRVKTADILARMHTKPGDLYSADAIQNDCRLIYNSGEFKEVGGGRWTKTAPGQVSITIPVVERATGAGDELDLDEKMGRVVPFLYDPVTDPFPIIQVSVNGQPPLPFVVDTGTSAPLVLDPWAAAGLGLKPPKLTEKAGNYQYATVPIQSAVFQGTNSDNNVLVNISQAQVVDLGFLNQFFLGQRVAGIVGLGMLAPVTARFDFAARTLNVFSYAHPPLRLPGATTLPLRRAPDGHDMVSVTLAPGTTADLIFDTGSTATGIPLAAMKALHPTAISYSHSQQIDGLYVTPELRLPALTLGSLPLPDVVVDVLSPPTVPSLGLNILTGYRLTLDGPNSLLILEPSARGGRYVQGWSGIHVRQTGGGWSVKALDAGSPASRAGMQIGDQILTVNGQSVQGLSLLQVNFLENGLFGRPLRVTLRRGQDKPVAISWTPLDDFSAPRHALYGLTMRKANGGPWVILSVLKGSPAAQAGMQIGDKITRLNGSPVAEMTLDQTASFMDQSLLSLTVTRTGRTTPLLITLSAPPPKP